MMMKNVLMVVGFCLPILVRSQLLTHIKGNVTRAMHLDTSKQKRNRSVNITKPRCPTETLSYTVRERRDLLF